MSGPRPDPDVTLRPFSRSLPMALMRARESAMRLFRPVLSSHGLTEQQWRVLRCLADAPDGLEVGEIAERTFLLGPSLSRILSRLDERGLVDRGTVAHDQRRCHVTLSPAGHDLVRTVAPHSEAAYGIIEKRYGTARLDQLTALLDELADIDWGTGGDPSPPPPARRTETTR